VAIPNVDADSASDRVAEMQKEIWETILDDDDAVVPRG
jgi:hypothetical protein